MNTTELRTKYTQMIQDMDIDYKKMSKLLKLSEQTIRNAVKNPEKVKLETLEVIANGVKNDS